MAAEKRADSPDRFLGLGLEYYLAGRFAFFQRCRIAGNLFHHGVELFLKFDVAQEDRPKYGHDLGKLWKAFKERDASRSPLARLDGVIEELNVWEHIRYSSFRISAASGVAVPQAITFSPQHPRSETHGDRELDTYVLCLEDMDELISAILTAAWINPTALFMPLAPEAVDWYVRENRHSLIAAGPPENGGDEQGLRPSA
jgi:hypothetical protein